VLPDPRASIKRGYLITREEYHDISLVNFHSVETLPGNELETPQEYAHKKSLTPSDPSRNEEA
jgi:hypothetical protein